MYEKHFGFLEDPFGVTPDPKFLYCSAGHAEALAALHYGLVERRGFLVLVARPGLGKTTLLHHLLERWKDRADAAFLFRPPETREQMIAAVLEDLGLEPASDYAGNCRQLRDQAVECCRRGRRLLLIFDEAQGIPPAVLEEIRLFSNLETPEEKLMEIVLAGQPALAERLRQPEREQIHQRVAIWAELGELDAAEVRRYVEHRLRIAGRKRGKLLTNRACLLLARASKGVPRIINTICFEALSLAFADGKKRIGKAEIRRACAAALAQGRPAALLPAPAKSTQHRFRWVAGAVFAALAAGVLAAGVYFQRRPTVAGAAAAQSWSAPPPPGVPPVQSAPAPNQEEAAPAAEPDPDQAPAELPAAERVRVQPSETMRRIALRQYGRWNPRVWEHIRKSNPGLTDPGKLKAGQILVLPAWESPRGGGQP